MAQKFTLKGNKTVEGGIGVVICQANRTRALVDIVARMGTLLTEGQQIILARQLGYEPVQEIFTGKAPDS